MSMTQYIVQSSADADVLNAINSIIDIDFRSGQIVDELLCMGGGNRSLYKYLEGVVEHRKKGLQVESVANVTFFPADRDELIHLIGHVEGSDSSTIPNTTFVPIYRDDLVSLIDFLRVQKRSLKREDMAYEDDEYVTYFFLDEDEFFIDELDVDNIYEGVTEVLDQMDDNLNLYYYASF